MHSSVAFISLIPQWRKFSWITTVQEKPENQTLFLEAIKPDNPLELWWNNKKVLVTGGASFVTSFNRKLIKQGACVQI